MNKYLALKIIWLTLIGSLLSASQRQERFEAISLHLQPDSYPLDVTKMDKIGLTYGNGTVDFYMASMSRMVRLAYGVKEYQLPQEKWFKNKYSGRATFPKDTPAGQIPAMIRTMLEERFGLRAHIASKTTKVWFLEQAPGGARLAPPAGKPMYTPGIPFPYKVGESGRSSNSDPLHAWLILNSRLPDRRLRNLRSTKFLDPPLTTEAHSLPRILCIQRHPISGFLNWVESKAGRIWQCD